MIHAGLECSILQKKIPGARFISVGPTIYDEHTPKERVSINSILGNAGFVKKLLIALSDSRSLLHQVDRGHGLEDRVLGPDPA